MTKTIVFNRELGYLGQARASLMVEVIPTVGAKFKVPVILDTGAGISKLDHSLAVSLGIGDIKATTRTTKARAANEAETVGYIHDVTLIFLGKEMTIPAAFCPDWPAGGDNLLGMAGFFEQGIYAFDHSHRKVYFNAWPSTAPVQLSALSATAPQQSAS